MADIKITPKLVLSKIILKQVQSELLKAMVRDIKAGRGVAQQYHPNTIKKRRKYGLPTDSIRLYGNNAYSNKAFRTLEDLRPGKATIKTLEFNFKHPLSRVIYKSWVDRYGDVFGRVFSQR